jgi:hypothetical protein
LRLGEILSFEYPVRPTGEDIGGAE